MNQDNLKLVVFDLNETLISENTWMELNLAMGVKPEEDEQFMRWYEEGVISYEEGQRFLEKIYRLRGHGNKEKMIGAMKYSFRPGAEDLIEYLHSKGYTVALLSGAIDLLVEKVAGEVKIDLHGAHNQLEFDENGMFKRIICDGDDADFKLKKTREFAKSLGIEMNQIVCVGDSYNDVKIFNETGRGITFADSKIADKAWKTVANLSEIKSLL